MSGVAGSNAGVGAVETDKLGRGERGAGVRGGIGGGESGFRTGGSRGAKGRAVEMPMGSTGIVGSANKRSGETGGAGIEKSCRPETDRTSTMSELAAEISV